MTFSPTKRAAKAAAAAKAVQARYVSVWAEQAKAVKAARAV